MNGDLQPVFFGSALNNFGVRELLDAFVEIAPMPQPKESDTRMGKTKKLNSWDLFSKFTQYGSETP